MADLPVSPTTTITSAHRGSISTLCYNSTGSYVLSGGSNDRVIRLWNSGSGNMIQEYRMHAHEVLDLAITPDSSNFASCGGDRTVFLWDVRTSKAVSRFSDHLAQVNCVCFLGTSSSPGSAQIKPSVLASGSFDGTVKLWDLRNSNTSKPIQTLADAKDSVSAVDVYSHYIYTASVDGKLRTYDLRQGTLTTDPVDANSGSPLTSLSVLQDGEAAIVTSLNSKITLVDLHQPSGLIPPLQVFHGHHNENYRLKPALACNDTLVLSPSEGDGYIYVWDLMDEKPIRKLDATRGGSGGAKGGFALAVSPSETPIKWVSSTGSGDLLFW